MSIIPLLLEAISYFFGLLDYVINISGYFAFFAGIWLRLRKPKRKKRDKYDPVSDQKED